MRALSAWYHQLKAEPGRPRLVCFPFAGGGTGAYRGWERGLAGLAEIIVARPPGRETRLNERALSEVASLAGAALEALRPLIDERDGRPFAFFGHSLGAWVAFEMTRTLFREGGRTPAALVVSGQHAPDFDSGREKVARMPRERFMKELVEFAGTPPELLAEAELMDLLLPTLRADFAAAEDYARVVGPPIDVPLFVYNGRGDRDVPPGADADWAREVVRPPTFRAFDGGHFFIQTAQAQVLASLREDLEQVFGGKRAA